MLLEYFCFYSIANIISKKYQWQKKILSKFSSIVSKHDVLTNIFCIFLHQILPPWNIRLQLDFHIDHKQIKEIPGKNTSIEGLLYLFRMYSIFLVHRFANIFWKVFNKYLSKSKSDFCICLYIDTLHCTYIYYYIGILFLDIFFAL